jgi:hypothetical protein
MLRLTSMIALLMAMGCGSKDDGAGDGSGDGGGNGGGCGAPELSADLNGLYYSDNLTIKFTKDTDDEATVALTDAAGAELSGTTTWDDEDTMVFDPDDDLDPATAYVATVTHCADVAVINFETSGLGAALEGGPESLEGMTYAVDLAAANFVKPEGVGALLGSLLTQSILIGVTEANDNTISMVGALSKENPSTDQDMCEPSIEFPVAADFTAAPYFSIEADELSLAVSDFNVGIKDFTLSGEFASDGSYMGRGVLAGLIDSRDLVDALIGGGLLGEGSTAADVCELLASFTVECEPCSDGEVSCLSIEVDEIEADETGTSVVEQDECDPTACEEGCG